MLERRRFKYDDEGFYSAEFVSQGQEYQFDGRNPQNSKPTHQDAYEVMKRFHAQQMRDVPGYGVSEMDVLMQEKLKQRNNVVLYRNMREPKPLPNLQSKTVVLPAMETVKSDSELLNKFLKDIMSRNPRPDRIIIPLGIITGTNLPNHYNTLVLEPNKNPPQIFVFDPLGNASNSYNAYKSEAIQRIQNGVPALANASVLGNSEKVNNQMRCGMWNAWFIDQIASNSNTPLEQFNAEIASKRFDDPEKGAKENLALLNKPPTAPAPVRRAPVAAAPVQPAPAQRSPVYHVPTSNAQMMQMLQNNPNKTYVSRYHGSDNSNHQPIIPAEVIAEMNRHPDRVFIVGQQPLQTEQLYNLGGFRRETTREASAAHPNWQLIREYPSNGQARTTDESSADLNRGSISDPPGGAKPGIYQRIDQKDAEDPVQVHYTSDGHIVANTKSMDPRSFPQNENDLEGFETNIKHAMQFAKEQCGLKAFVIKSGDYPSADLFAARMERIFKVAGELGITPKISKEDYQYLERIKDQCNPALKQKVSNWIEEFKSTEAPRPPR